LISEIVKSILLSVVLAADLVVGAVPQLVPLIAGVSLSYQFTANEPPVAVTLESFLSQIL